MNQRRRSRADRQKEEIKEQKPKDPPFLNKIEE